MSMQPYWAQRYAALDPNVGPLNDGCRYDLLKRVLERYNPKTVCEMGAGYGRWFGLYSEYPDKCFVAADFVEWALLLAAKNKPENVVLWQADVTKRLPWNDNTFHMVILVEVLQHIPATNIKWAVSEIARIAEKQVVVMDFYDKPENQHILAKHCWQHDYPKLFAGLKLEEQTHVGGAENIQEMFVWSKQKNEG